MSLTGPAPYMFDLDFDAEHRVKDEVEVEPTISLYDHEAQMAALERRVREEAHAAGRQQAIDEGANALAEETQRLTGVATTLLTRLDAEIGLREERGVRIAITAAKKLARRLLEEEPMGEVENLFRACLAPMFDASHLVVRMHEEHVDQIRERLETIAEGQGFEGRLVFLGEETYAPGDARIEWADGGIARSQNNMEKEIDMLVEGYLAARSSSSDAPPLPQTPNDDKQAIIASMEGAHDE